MTATSLTTGTGNVSFLHGRQDQSSLSRHATMTLEQLSEQDSYRIQRTKPSGLRDLIPPSLVVKPQDLNRARHHSVSPAKMGRLKLVDATLYFPSSRFVLKGLQEGLHAKLACDGDVVTIVKYLPDQGRYRVSLVQKLSAMPVIFDVRHHNLVPASGEISTTREPKQTERRSLLQLGTRDSRSKLTKLKPDLSKASSMSNVMARAETQRNQQSPLRAFQLPFMPNITSKTDSARKPELLRDCSMPDIMARRRRSLRTFKHTSMPNVMVTPPKKPTNQRSLRRELSERTSKSDSELLKRRSDNERAFSARDVTANARNQMSRRALMMEKKQTSEGALLRASRQPSEAKRDDDAQMLPKRLAKPVTKNPALNGQTVTIAKFLEDDNRNRVNPHNVEAADATSTYAVSPRKVPATAHATRRLSPVMIPNTSSQRSVVHNRESGPCSGNVTPTSSRVPSSKAKIPADQTSQNESCLGVITLCPYLLEDEFPGVSR